MDVVGENAIPMLLPRPGTRDVRAGQDKLVGSLVILILICYCH